MTGIIPLIFLFKSLGLGIDVIDPGKHLTVNISQVIPQEQFIPDTITTGKLTISQEVFHSHLNLRFLLLSLKPGS
jgi:hypothetical protein